MEAIYKRRSIRKYTSDSIPDHIVEDIIKAGMNAPSAGNERPWHFLVIRKRELLEEITTIHPYSAMLKQAPVAILICADISLEKFKGFWVQDCSAAAQNMLLEIADRDLGSVWLGVYPIDERVKGIRKIFNLPEHVEPFAIIPVGKPAEEKPPKNEFDKERIHYDIW